MLKRLSIIDFVNIIFFLIICSFAAVAFTDTPYKINLLIIFPILLVPVFLGVLLRNKALPWNLQNLLMIALPILFLFAIFETFYMILPYFNGNRYDELLARIDLDMLGISPTVWISKFVHPFLTDLFYALYLFYFPMPLIILGWMFKKKMFRRMEKELLLFQFCYYGAYILYFLVPAEGPRFYLAQDYSVALDGYFIAEPVRLLINFLEPNKLDAFPSLHAAILLTTMIVAFRNNRKMFYWFIPAAIGIFISLVYCRYHYVIDVIAGVIWTVAVVFLSNLVYNRFHHRFATHFGEQKS